jgi:hypothetical protein
MMVQLNAGNGCCHNNIEASSTAADPDPKGGKAIKKAPNATNRVSRKSLRSIRDGGWNAPKIRTGWRVDQKASNTFFGKPSM